MRDRSMYSLPQDESGNVAAMFALAVVPVFLLFGAAIDYSRAVSFRDFARASADTAALAIANTPADGAKILATVKDRITKEYGSTVPDLAVTGEWDKTNAYYEVTVKGSLKAYLLPAVPGLGKQDVPVDVKVKVERIPPKYETRPPTSYLISPEAGDYNRLYMYCYNPARKNEADKGRRGMAAFADNSDKYDASHPKFKEDPKKYKNVDYSVYVKPTCAEGEIVSYKLRNVRNMRTDPSKWTTPDKWDVSGLEVYEYYTDTTMNSETRVMTHTLSGGRVNTAGQIPTPTDLNSRPILETIVCDNQDLCQPSDVKPAAGKPKGILPKNHDVDRVVTTSTAGCTEGKYLYFGWEDRPPRQSLLAAGKRDTDSDRDYDDIRVVVSCPKEVVVVDTKIHLVN